MPDAKITELSEATSVATTDILPVVTAPGTSPVTKKVTVSNLTAGSIQKTIVDAKGDLITASADNTPVRQAVGTDGQVLVSDSNQTNGLQWINPSHSMARQAIMNGNFDVWQRGTSFTNPASATYMPDRWRNAIALDGGTPPTNIIISRQSATAGDLYNSFYYLRVNPNGAGSSYGNGSVYYNLQRIENGTRFLCGDGKKVTVSFYARASVASKKLGITLIQKYGTGGSPTAQEILTGTAVTLTSSWAKYTYTFTTNTLASKTFGTANDDHLELGFGLQWGSTVGTSQFGGAAAEGWGGSGTIDIAQVQLCAGDVALPFMPKSYEEELRACQRYARDLFGGSAGQYIAAGIASIVDTTTAKIGIYNPVRMRTTPTLNTGFTVGNLALGYTGAFTLSALSVEIAQPDYILLTATSSGMTANTVRHLYRSNTTEKLIVEAEL